MSRAFLTALEILRAEEQARARSFQRTPEPVKPPAKPKTMIHKWHDKIVKKRKVLADVKGSGRLVKCRIISPTDDFKVLLQIDGETVLDDTYTDLTDVLAAYEEDDEYYLHLEEKAFRERLVIIVSVTQAVTFPLLFAEALVEN